MNPVSRRFAFPTLCLAFALLAGAAQAATTEPLDLDPDILAEIARQKARATTQARQAANAGKPAKPGATQPGAECGSVNVGNVIGGGRIGFAPIDVTVVVLGDIVNANNKCK